MDIKYIILGMFLVTYGTRFIVLKYFSTKKMHDVLKSALNYVPPVVLTAIIIPTVLFQNDYIFFNLKNNALIAGILTSIIAVKTKHLLSTIVLGMAIFWILKIFNN